MTALLNFGVIGLGRMGQLYAQVLQQIPDVRLYAIADMSEQARAHIGNEFSVTHIFADAYALLALSELDAVVITTPTSTHSALVLAAAKAKKAIFCEKPLALTVEDTVHVLVAIENAHIPLQVGFMRRFDAGYQRAKAMIDDGQIGYPVTFKAISRDPFCPPSGYLDPAQNGGFIVDMGIHDFDLARWLMNSEVQRVTAEGTTLVCKELAAVGDIDNAVVNLRFESGALGNVEMSRNAFYGYDIRTEVLGSEGALMIGTLQHTPVVLLNRTGVQHDTKPYLMERFGDAYRSQLVDFVDCLRHGRTPIVGGTEALAACEISVAATLAYKQGRPVQVSEVKLV